MMDHIESLLEDELKRRIDMTMSPFIEYISNAYDISMQQLFKDYMMIMHMQRKHICKGTTAKKKPCSRAAGENGYCKMHQTQYKPSAPSSRVILGASSSSSKLVVVPKSKVVRDVASCFINT